MRGSYQCTALEKLFGGFGALNHPVNFLRAVSTSNPDPEVSLKVPHTTPGELYPPLTLRGITEGKSDIATTQRKLDATVLFYRRFAL